LTGLRSASTRADPEFVNVAEVQEVYPGKSLLYGNPEDKGFIRDGEKQANFPCGLA
jgi:hypothetical protein